MERSQSAKANFAHDNTAESLSLCVNEYFSLCVGLKSKVAAITSFNTSGYSFECGIGESFSFHHCLCSLLSPGYVEYISSILRKRF